MWNPSSASNSPSTRSTSSLANSPVPPNESPNKRKVFTPQQRNIEPDMMEMVQVKKTKATVVQSKEDPEPPPSFEEQKKLEDIAKMKRALAMNDLANTFLADEANKAETAFVKSLFHITKRPLSKRMSWFAWTYHYFREIALTPYGLQCAERASDLYKACRKLRDSKDTYVCHSCWVRDRLKLDQMLVKVNGNNVSNGNSHFRNQHQSKGDFLPGMPSLAGTETKGDLEAYDNIDPKPKKMKNKDINCALRLFNVMFSDKFVPKFMGIGNQRTRFELDTNNSPEMAFWKEVLLDYLDESNPHYGQLQYHHQALQRKGINPSKICFQMDWRKLQSTFRFVRGLWSAAFSNHAASREYGSDFWFYCNGRLDVLYLYLHTRQKPYLINAVRVNMTVNATFDSENYKFEDLVARNGNVSSSGKRRSSSSKKKENEYFREQMLDAFTKATDNTKSTNLFEKQTKMLMSREDLLAKKSHLDYEIAAEEKDRQSLKFYSELSEQLRKLRSHLASEPLETNQTSIKEEIAIYERKLAMMKRSMLLSDESRSLKYDDNSIDGDQ